MHRELRAFALSALDRHIGTVELGEPPGDRKPETVPFAAAAPGGIRAIEAIEDSIERYFGYPLTGVGDSQAHRPTLALERDRARLRMCQGVLDKVSEHAPKRGIVAFDHDVCAR